MSRIARAWLRLASLAVCMASCDASPATLADSFEAASIANTAPEMHLAIGGSASVSGQVLDQQGRLMPEARAVFTSDDPGVAAVDTSGMVRGVSAGTANVTAAFGKAKAVTRVTVVRPEGPVRRFSLQADSVLLGVNGQAVEVLVRWASANGESECPPLDVRSDAPIAGIIQIRDPCRLSIRGTALGRAVVTASAEGATDTLRIIVSRVASQARFASSDVVSTLGIITRLSVYVTDETGHPIGGQTVHFAVTAGTLSEASTVSTGYSGVAEVLYNPPTNLRRDGSEHQASFSATMADGTVVTGTAPIKVNPGRYNGLLFYRRNNATGVFERFDGNTLTAAPGEEVAIGMRGDDGYGNAREVYVGGGFSQNNDFVDVQVSPYTARVCGMIGTKDREGNALAYTCVRLDSAGTVHVRAQASRSCRIGCDTPRPYDLYVRFAAP